MLRQMILALAILFVGISPAYAGVSPVVPEPSTIALFSIGAIGVGVYALLKRKKKGE